MFQTLQPQYQTATKHTFNNKVRRIYFDHQRDHRPKTVGFHKGHLETLTPKSNFFKTLDTAQLQLTTEFRNQMSPFIKQKIRNSLSRNSKRRVVISRALSNYDDPQQLDLISSINEKKFNRTIDSLNQTSPLSNRSFKISVILSRQSKSPFTQRQMIPQSILTNTKQKIDRLIEMKRQKDLQFQHLKKSIQRKCSKVKDNNFKKTNNIFDSSKNKPAIIQNLQWDQEWKEQTKKQSHRYRNRLLSKHKRQNCMKIKICEAKLPIQA